jgi:hypothetical protein
MTLGDGARAGFDGGRVPSHTGLRLVSDVVETSSSGSAPRDKNPFHGMWMTRDRPPIPTRLSPTPAASSFPTSAAAVSISPADVHSAATAAANQNAWTQYCVARC